MLVMEGDFTYPARHVARLIDKALREGLDEAIGARRYGRENIPILNRLGNWVITKTFNLLFGTQLSDVCSGMYLVKTEVARRAGLGTRGFSVEVELAAHIASTTWRIGEVPIEYRRRVGESKLRRRHGVMITLDALKLAMYSNPVFLFFAASSLVLILLRSWRPGLGTGGLFTTIHDVKHYVWGIIAVVGLGVSFVSLLFAALTLYLKRLEYRILEMLRG